MKTYFMVLVSAVLLINISFGQSVINAVPAPRNASGLCWVNGYLWCGAYGVNGDTLYKINPSNGTVVKKFKWHSHSYADCYGLAFDTISGGSLWVSSHYSSTVVGDSIFLVDTITGARKRTIPANRTYMAGLANDGQALWHCCYYNPDGRAYRVNKSTGTPFDSINIPGIPQPWGATWDGQYLWVCNDGNYGGAHRIYKINVNTYQIIDSLDSPGTRPFGLAWDGLYLWVIANGTSPTGKVAYQIDLGGSGTPDIQITPTTYNFGNVPYTSTPYFNLNIANVGTDTLTIDTIFSTNSVFHYQATAFPRILAPNTNANLSVMFSPTAFQLYTGSLGISSDDPDEETVYVSLRGQGVYPNPYLSPSATNYNFGDVRINCVSDWFLRIVNQGYPILLLDSIKYTSDRFFSGRINPPIVLNCLETTYVQVITRANALGVYNGNIQIYSNAAPNPYIISLSANGIPNNLGGGQLMWSYDFPDNVVCVSPLIDINNDSIFDVVTEAYGTNMSGKKHLCSYWGNSSGLGVVQWAVGDADFSGSWGDECLILGADYNNDGHRDIILGTAWGDRSVYTINSLNGQVIWQYDSHSYDGEGGWVYSVKPMPDITGDSVGEVLAGIGGNSLATGGPRSVYCFNGANGNILWQYRAQDGFGCVDWIADLNNDGVPDVIAGAWGNSYDKRVYCINGATGGLLWSHLCTQDVQSVIAIPDINGDNKWDVVSGDWSGTVKCLSGANGNPIWTTSLGGWVVKLKAIPDLISTNRPGIAVANVSGVTTFNVLNCNNGSIYWSYPTGSNVWTVDAINDLNGDNKMEVITGNQTPGTVYCLSGADGSLIWSYNVGKLIYSIRSISDISGDGRADVLVGTQGSTTGIGHVLAICGGNYSGISEETNPAKIKNLICKVYPNPCNRMARIYYTVPISGKVSLKLYNAAGRLVKVLHDGYLNAGEYTNKIEIRNSQLQIPAGIYFLKYEADTNRTELKLIIQ